MSFSIKRERYFIKSVSRIFLLNCVASVALFHVSAFAQEAPKEASKEANSQPPTDSAKDASAEPKTEEVIIVNGVKTINKLDRKAYDLKNDIATQTGTAADALNQLPSVSVDADGNVSLRGKQNVEVLINGKSSAMLKGDNRATTLLSISGADISSVEVMSTPGASFSSEGSGGIINLVMRKNRRPGKYFTLNSTMAEHGRANANISGNYTTNKFNVSGGLSYRRDNRVVKNSVFIDNKNPVFGSVAHDEKSSYSKSRRTSYSANTGVELFLGDSDTVGIIASYGNRTRSPNGIEKHLGHDSNGNIVKNYQVANSYNMPRNETGASINWEHQGANPDETLKLDLKFSNAISDDDNFDYYNYSVPALSAKNEFLNQKENVKNWVLSLDYNKPFNDDVLTTGLQIDIDDNSYFNDASFVDNSNVFLSNNLLKTNKFKYYQNVTAFYGTYEKYFSEKWSGQIGLRVENTDINTLNPISNISSSANYNNISPSAFVTYGLNDDAQLRFSYSKRLDRPDPSDLNPTPDYINAENIVIGNPNLRPQTSDDFEIGYEYSKDGLSYDITGFYSRDKNLITDVSNYVGNNIIETTKINSGNAYSGGIEFNLNKKFYKKLKVNLNGTLDYSQIPSLNSNKSNNSGLSLGGSINLDYNINPKNRLQFMLHGQGKTYDAQGYSNPMMMSNITYSYNVKPNVFLTMNMTDPFALGKFKNYINNDNFTSVSTRKFEARTIFFGVRVMLGDVPKSSNRSGYSHGPH